MFTPPTAQPQQSDLQLEIAHLLLIDIVGYSKLLVDEQIDSVQELGRVVKSTECFRKAEADGKLIRVPTGDGMALLFFHSPEEPVRCALEIAQKLKGNSKICLRMGIHSGPINQVRDVNDALNVAGTGINVAQRIMDCADGGHILLSKHLAEDLAPYQNWRPYLHDLGECEAKHGMRLHIFNLYKDGLGNPTLPEKLRRGKRWKQISRAPVRPVSVSRWPKAIVITALALSVVALITSFILTRRAVPTSSAEIPGAPVSEKSIAVLPFENLSADQSNAYFADGVQDEILTRLSKISDLKVISRTSTQSYRSAPQNLREVGKQLGVANIVEGTVQKSGDTVRVSVQLIKVANDSHLWGESFDRKLTDIFSVESDVAKAIADQLQTKLTGREKETIAAKSTDNPEAYDAYLRALACTLKAANTPSNSLAAQQYLKEAVRLDPNFALGWSLLSYVDAVGYSTGTLPLTDALREEARRAAETALMLQPNLGEALHANGYYHYAILKDYTTAMHYFDEARRFLPNSSRLQASLAYIERRQGHWDKSEAYFSEAERLDPRNVKLLTQHADSYLALRRFPEALRKLDQVLNIAPGDVDTIVQKAAIAQAEGDLPRGSALLAPLDLNPNDPAGLEQTIYQAILERRPTPMNARLKEILIKPDRMPGFTGELRFWLGWAQQVGGDGGAQATLRQARSELESIIKEQPGNWGLILDLALTDACLGDKASAFALAERVIAANPLEKDALTNTIPIEILARVAARTGDADRAIPALEKLLSIPGAGHLASNGPLTPALLRLDPMFDPLRGNPRFERLLTPTTRDAPKK